MKAFRLDRQEMSPFFSYVYMYSYVRYVLQYVCMLLCTVKLNVCAFVCGIARYIIIVPDGYAQGLAGESMNHNSQCGEKVDLSRGTTALFV